MMTVRFLSCVVAVIVASITDEVKAQAVVDDCASLESELIEDVRSLGVDSKDKLFDTIERLNSRGDGANQCTNSEWRLNYGHLSYYKIGDGTPTGPGCTDLPYVSIPWPYDTNDKGVDNVNYPEAHVTEGTCDGFVLTCTPEPIKTKYSYSRPTNTCPRVYCVTDADPLVAGEYWEDISNFVQDQVPRYIKGEIDYSKYEECRFPKSPSAAPITSSPTTASPSDAPTKKPTTSEPTIAPADPPTMNPTLVPKTSNPTSYPTYYPTNTLNDPTFPPVAEGSQIDCPEDLSLIRSTGVTPLPKNFVQVVDQQKETVTVALHQTLSASVGTSLDHVFLYYQESEFDNKCYGWDDVEANARTPFATIEIVCNVLTPYAMLEICVADDASKAVLSVDDTAEIPQCCHAPPEVPPSVICHVFEISCVSECMEGQSGVGRRRRRRLMRGLAQK